jgi:hypothetical protein
MFSGPIYNTYFGYFPNQKAALLMNGNVLFSGGNVEEGDSDVAQLFDLVGSMNAPRDDHTATLLPDSTVLIAGSRGVGGRTLSSAELYDPVTGIFRNTGNMSTDRRLHTATLLNDGSVLIAGGIQAVAPFSSFGVALSSAEIYHPVALIPAPVLLSLSGDGKG